MYNDATEIVQDVHAQNASIVADYIRTAESIATKKEAAHKAALAIRKALWKKGDDGALSGKDGRNYFPEVAAVLTAAYPMPDNATKAQVSSVRVARSKLYGVIDTTTARTLGHRGDRNPTKKGANHKRKMAKGGKATKVAPDTFGALDAAWRKADGEYAEIATLVARLADECRGNKAALNTIGSILTVLNDRPAFNALGQLIGDGAIDAGTEADDVSDDVSEDTAD